MYRLLPVMCSLAFVLTLASGLEASDHGLGDIKTLRLMPRSEDEIAHSYERLRGQSCEPIAPGEPLEITGFTPCLTDRDRTEFDRGAVLIPSSRRHLFSIGLEMTSADRSRLPTISGGQILRYLREHYVTVQARVQKDPISGELFLHHRPLAVTAGFGRGGLTRDFTDATLAAIRDFRSLGVYLPGDQPQTPENLRTLVMLFRSVLLVPGELNGKLKLKPKYEWVFIRARPSDSQPGSPLVLHTFATSEHRQRLHYLRPYSSPLQPPQCGVHANVLFTEYSTLGLVPTKSATRNVSYDTRTSYAMTELDQYRRDHGGTGDSLDDLPATLDAIIDGLLPSQ